MSIFRSCVAAGLLLSTVAFGADVDKAEILSREVVIDNFDDEFGDQPHQTTIGAARGMVTSKGDAYLGGGYWYTYADEDGSVVNDIEGTTVTGEEASVLFVQKSEDEEVYDGMFAVSLKTSTSDNKYPYAVLGCNLIGDDKKDKTPVDLTNMTSLSIKMKGEVVPGKGQFRVLLKTGDFEGEDWGHYGFDIDELSDDWETIDIPVASLKAEEGHTLGKTNTFKKNGAKEVYVMEFKAKNGADATVYIDEIVAKGAKYADFGWDTTHVTLYSSRNNVASKNLSVKGTNVSFSLAQSQNLTLTLNDIMGNKISTLFAGKAASKSINVGNMRIPNGRYLVVLSGQNTKLVQPIAIMK